MKKILKEYLQKYQIKINEAIISTLNENKYALLLVPRNPIIAPDKEVEVIRVFGAKSKEYAKSIIDNFCYNYIITLYEIKHIKKVAL